MIGITGATGALGGRVARRFAGEQMRLIVRDPGRAPDVPGAQVAVAAYGDAAALADAFAGVDVLFLVSAKEAADRVGQHTRTVDAAAAAGVQRVVYTSFLGAGPDATFTFARDHWHTERHIRGSGMAFTFLRDSLYLDLVPFFAGDDGVIAGPAGDGRVAAVARDDVADVADCILRAPDDYAGKTFDLTGPYAFSLAELAAEMTRVTGKPVRYVAETLPEAYHSRARFGAPRWELDGWVTSYTAIAAGELDVVSDAVQAIAGHPPIGMREFLRRLAS
jgi:NAD(P)H dehydrogenase (quinone)